MKSDWMAASNYGRIRELISAINTISIHAKLTAAGIKDPHNQNELTNAREKISSFLKLFEGILNDAKVNPNGIIIESDPRMAELAQVFLSEKQHLPQESELFALPLDQLRELASSDKTEEMADLIACLRDLRSILEQHVHSDVVGIIGEI